MSCDNPGNNAQLIAACSCKTASDALNVAVTNYEKQLEDYTKKQAVYNSALNNYNTLHSQWSSDKSNQIATLTNEKIRSGCGKFCDQGWNETDKEYCWATADYNRFCQRNSDQVNKDLGPWLSLHPEPQSPSKPEAFAGSPPTGNNILCCSQLFNNIDANSVHFTNTSQNCSQEINKQIADASGKPYTPTSSTPWIMTKTGKLIILAIVVLLLLISISLVTFASQKTEQN